MHNLKHFPIKLIYFLSARIATTSHTHTLDNVSLATHLPTRIATTMICKNVQCLKSWQPTCLRGLQRVGVIIFITILFSGNPLVYEDCNCKIFVICECYGTKDLLSYGGKCKKVLTRRKSTGSDSHNILLSYKFTLNLQH